MDALIYGYSNFTYTAPTTTTRVSGEVASSPVAFDETDNRFSQKPTPVLITPTMETVKPTYFEPSEAPTFIRSYEEERTFVPIIDIINPTPVYVKPDEIPTFTPSYEEDNVRPPAPRPTPIPTPVYVKPDVIPTFTPSYEEDNVRPPAPRPTPIPTPVYVKPDVIPTVFPTYEEDNVVRTILDSKPYHAPTESISTAPTLAPPPIVNIINPSPYSPPPLIVGGGGAMGGGGSMGGGEARKPLSGSVATKPSFIKKNFIPILLIASAIYVFIKKPIK